MLQALWDFWVSLLSFARADLLKLHAANRAQKVKLARERGVMEEEKLTAFARR